MKLLGCFALFTAVYVALGVAVAVEVGVAAGVATFLAAPLTGYATVRFTERFRRIGGVVGAYRTLRRRPDQIATLQAHRLAVAELTAAAIAGT